MTRRCACRPGCLSWLQSDDDTVTTPTGEVLFAHTAEADAYPQEPMFEIAVVAS